MTDLWSFNTGRVQAKMGVNEKEMPEKTPVSFALLDNHHLSKHGVRYFAARSRQAVIITSNPSHPAFHVPAENLHIIYQEEPSLKDALRRLKSECGCDRLTVQSGGSVNSLFLREKLLDYVDIVMAPVLIGGRDTPTMIDGPSLKSVSQLQDAGILRLEKCSVLEDSYIRLQYRVVG
jgi:2,5-diamino-6-(ribosylamino)-4(3H)-pyrimidinone 5'-phosphate reductase